MAKSSKPKNADQIETEVDPTAGDKILKRMLHTKPRPHSEMNKGKDKSKGTRKK